MGGWLFPAQDCQKKGYAQTQSLPEARGSAFTLARPPVPEVFFLPCLGAAMAWSAWPEWNCLPLLPGRQPEWGADGA